MSRTFAAVASAVALAAGLSACVSPTPYQPLVKGGVTSGGYTETRIEPNRWRVTFAGNTMTKRETVEGYLLFRAAELTLQNGDDWFAMVDRQTDAKSRTYVQPDPFYHPWYGPGFGYWRPAFEASAEIVTHKGAKPADDPRAFDAHAVVENLKPKIQYPVAK